MTIKSSDSESTMSVGGYGGQWSSYREDDIEYDKKTGGREIFRYSTLAKALIEKDEIA